MKTVNAFYYDGRSSARIPVSVQFSDSGDVTISGESLCLTIPFKRISIASRLGDSPRSLFLPGGGKLETKDNDAIDAVCSHFATNRWQGVLHQLEKHWLYVLPSLLFSIFFIWASVEYGMPVAAKWAAAGIPKNIERQLGEQTLSTLDDWLFTDSLLDDARKNHIHSRFKAFTARSKLQYDYSLLLRNSEKMGANALALPGGIIVVTDAFVDLAENDDQILAVLAHEMGHVEYRHGIRSMLQNSFTALLMIGLLGDVSSVSSLSATLPTVLVQNRYSRKFEQQADSYAVNLMKKQHIDIDQFIRILTLLTKTHHGSEEFDYLSTHPAMGKRIDLIKSMQTP